MNNYKHTNLTTNQALNKLKQNGKNQLIKAKKKNVFALFLSQLANPMIVVLIVSAIFSYIISLYSKEGISDVIIILTVVFLNSLLGVIQEAKAEKAINALNDLTPKKSKIIRDNEIKFILSEDLVTDDIVIIESGDIIPADGILLENHSLKIDESTLTGESIAKEKDLTNDNNYVQMVTEYAKKEGAQTVKICAKLESELSELTDDDKKEMLSVVGIEESGLDKLIKITYDILGLATYFTVGSDEVRAWTFKKGMNAKECMIEADKLLQKWSCYSIENRRYIEKIFNGSNRYDMMLNVDVMQKQAKIYVLERGVTIYEYRTERKEIVIYAVLRDIIGIISDTFIRDSYVDEKGYLHFTENVSNYRKKIADEAFSLMGEPYNEWNRQGISIWDFNRSFAGE